MNNETRKNWIVTASDSKAFDTMLVSFIASARTIGKWTGKIAVVDLGLTNAQKSKLVANDITVFKQANESKTIVCDRFFSLYNQMNDYDVYAHFDADIWFSEDINPLFENYEGKFVCTKDCNYQGFITGVIPNEVIRQEYKNLIDAGVVRDFGKPLQVGFVMGTRAAYTPFIGTLKELIVSRIAADAYGTDTLAINMMYVHYPEAMKVMDISYNCLPDWSPRKDGKSFFVGDLLIRAIHQTSPYRKNDSWSFSKNFPEQFVEWQITLSTPKDFESTLEKVIVKNIDYFIRRGTWDHTILFHTNEYSVSKIINYPKNTCIVDIGAHIGGFTKLIATHYPDVQIFSFEPDPNNYEMLRRNTEGLKNVKIFNYGVGGEDTTGAMSIPDALNTGMNRVNVGAPGNIKIISPTSLFTLIGNYEIALMKIDCEGGEWAFFDTLTPSQYAKIWEIQGEIHTDLFSKHPPFKDFPAYNEPFVRKLLREKMKNFTVFVDSSTVKAYNNNRFC